ncbi:DNA ligase D [Massilia sp. CF038]|uniref:DNA ligase D n=1 Tax=Massilia sp. CF038 TaxID=1881045 RepID=UPI000918D011|nr:DNA ligase D [Massilia sp. CF038]SHH00331.1 ATP-dependent DNA ligase LigD phosphoesterase module /ATP-dependent DNA ligase LigD polymerase module [Massilia sp. CF038]
MSDPLKAYKAKRNFKVTSEPAEGGRAGTDVLTFVIQKHWASRLHYDFRLELDGTMKSWAVPKGPSYDPKDKRMAVHVEDHPISYSDFEGTIPEKQYGAGKVIIWDKGTWAPLGDPHQGYQEGNLKFEMHGHKMQGKWALIRMKGKGEKQEPWLLIKEKDELARPADAFSVVDELPDSVKSLPMPQAAKPNEGKPAAEKAASQSGIPEAAVEAALPDIFTPELATLVDKPPSVAEDWIFEIKFDGYRLLTRVDGKDIKLFTRNGHDWSHKLPKLHKVLVQAGLPDGWYDGEIVVHDENGRPNFGLLQLAFDGSDTADIVYFVFDAPYIGGMDLRAVPLMERRAVLKSVFDKVGNETLRFSQEFGTDPDELVVAACKLGLEGVIGKRRDSRYVQRRSPDWIKLKCGQRQEFVIGGYTDPQGSRTGIGSLLLGAHDDQGVLQYAGNVGTGFNEATLRDLKKKLDDLATDDSPFPPKAVAGRKHHWVKPRLIAEVSFAEWTSSGSIRHAVFHGLRADKPAKNIGREKVKQVEEDVHTQTDPAAPQGKLPATLKITHGERLIDAQSGATKLDMVRYYALVGELMMEHLKGRPVSLVRAPGGVGGELFFQKHAEVGKLPGMKQMDQALDPDHPPMLEVGSVEGILSAAQWNVIEFHTQNAVGGSYETPNRVVFDLDPGEGVEWKTMQEAAQLMHAFLDELGLPSFLKTSGGKGLHVVVPIKGTLDWDTVKDFSQAIVRHLSSALPDRFAFKSGPKNRVGKIFIDYLRNGQGATTACAWSARVRSGLGISVPLAWDELDALKAGDQWNIKNAHTRLDRGNEPWSGYAKAATTLTAAMKKLPK